MTKTLFKQFTVYWVVVMLVIPAGLIAEEAGAGVVNRTKQVSEIKLVPFDRIEINIYPQEEQNRTLEVDQDGKIFFSFLGKIPVKGLSEDQVAKKLTDLLRDGYLKDPNVTVKILRENHVVIMGHVQNPQTIPYEGGGLTFIEVVAMAGGFSEAASINRVKVVRRSGSGTETIHMNAKAILDGTEDDFVLENGDVIIVPATLQSLKENQVVIMGYVNNPQTFPVDDNGITFLQAIAMAGGFAELAAVTRVKIVRRTAGKTQTLRVNAKAIMSGKVDDFLLTNGDVIIVPERYF